MSLLPPPDSRRSRILTNLVIGLVLALVLLTFINVRDVGDTVETASTADVDRGRAVSEQNQTILDRIEEDQQTLEAGVDAVERGYLCLVALLLIEPPDRDGIDPARFAEVCLVDLAEAQLIAAGLEAGP